MSSQPWVEQRFKPGLSAIAEHYDLFLIDQWGVLHDGSAAYPGAVDCLRELKRRDKRVVILSNSGRRAAANATRLESLGIGTECYDRVVTSGEVGWRHLAQGDTMLGVSTTTRPLLLGSSADDDFLSGLTFHWADKVEEADWLVLAGIDDAIADSAYDALFARALQRRLPLLCLNPDHMRLTPAGLRPSAGAYARRYREAGGSVRFIGKPHPEIYALAMAAAPMINRRRVVAIGDSLHHDVAGGQSAGLDTALITSGVHAAELHGLESEPEFLAAIDKLLDDTIELPTWVVPRLRW